MTSHMSAQRKPFMQRTIRPERVMALGFLLVILIGTALLSLPVASVSRRSVGVMNAMFTATSSVCVTGLIVVDTGTVYSAFGKTVIILLIQIGGLGFMIFATLIMVALGRRISLRNRVLIRESMNTTNLSGLVRLSMWFFGLAFSIEFIGACLLSIRFIPMFGVQKGILYSAFHAISAFCNAGFDLFGSFQSLAMFQHDPLVLLTIAALIILGGLGFSVITECLHMRQNLRRLSLHSKLVLVITGALLLLGMLLTLALEWDNPGTLGQANYSVADKYLNAFFQSTTLRTAGFASFNQADLTDSSKLISVILMFIGASPASTGGGVKTTTMSALLLLVISVIRGRDSVNIFGKQLMQDTLKRALAIIVIGIGVVLATTCVLSISERKAGWDMLDLMYEAASAFATVGLTSVNTPALNHVSHAILMPIMFMGRVGPLTMAVALANRMDTRAKNKLHYPEEKIIIG